MSNLKHYPIRNEGLETGFPVWEAPPPNKSTDCGNESQQPVCSGLGSLGIKNEPPTLRH